MKWLSSAPANVMLMGEHSVVYGQPALVAALTPIIEITWQARDDRKLVIHSNLANWKTDLDSIQAHPKLQFVLQAIEAFAADLPCGLQLSIRSEFPSDWGLGSSAAVLAATLAGLNTISGRNLTRWQLFELGHRVILNIQGRGSGADLAASLNGGLSYFCHSEKILETLEFEWPLCLVYSGYKTPTAEVLAWVAEQWQSRTDKLNKLYQKMGQITRKAYQALQQNNQGLFFEQVNRYQQTMRTLGVSDETLEQIIAELNAQGITAKISGSGLGDCVVGFGKTQSLQNFSILNTQISRNGALCQTINE